LLGLHSEASLRFERGVDLNSVVRASDRATYLIAKYCFGLSPVVIGSMSKAGSEVTELPRVSVRIGQIKRLLDIAPSSKEIVEMLKPLKFELDAKANQINSEKLEFLVPSFRRRDVTREIDLIEEICRIYGYERLPQSMPHSTVPATPPEDTPARVREALSGQGMSEAYISSLVSPEDESELSDPIDFGTQDPKTLVRVLNPLSEDHQVMRQSLLPGLIRAAKYNRDHGEKNIWLFEIGRTYAKQASSKPADYEQSNQKQLPVTESTKVAGILTGNPTVSQWVEQLPEKKDDQNGNGLTQKNLEDQLMASPTSIDFYQAKGIIENLFNKLRFNPKQGRLWFTPDESAPPVMHPSKSARIFFDLDNPNFDQMISQSQDRRTFQSYGPENIGWLGEIHPSLADSLKLDSHTYLFELDMATLAQHHELPAFQPFATSPAVSRDLTIDIPTLSKHATHSVVVDCIEQAVDCNLVGIELMSIFGLNDTHNSLSYRLTFQSPEETMRSDQVDQFLVDIRCALSQKLGASFRD